MRAYEATEEDVFLHHLKELDKKDTQKVPANILAKFYIGAVFNVALEFLKKDSPYTKEDILNYLDYLIPNNIDM